MSNAELLDEADSDDSWIERGEECPICAKHRDPETGELRFNARLSPQSGKAEP